MAFRVLQGYALFSILVGQLKFSRQADLNPHPLITVPKPKQ